MDTSTGVQLARNFAIVAHGGQLYGDQPYVVHLDTVANLLGPFGEQAQIAGYLHDVVEDTAVGREQIAAEFGKAVAACVALVTDEAGANRRERKARTNDKLAAVTAENSLALIVKAADRLANLRASVQASADSKLGMYRKEHGAFRAAAYRAGLCEALWQEIEEIISERNA